MEPGEFVYLLPYLISLGFSLGVTIFAWQRREARGVSKFVWYLVGGTLWIGGFVFELLSPTLRGKIFWDLFQWLAGLIMVVAFPVFVIQYTGYKLSSPKLALGLSMAAPAVFAVFVLTDRFHHLIYPDPRLVSAFLTLVEKGEI